MKRTYDERMKWRLDCRNRAAKALATGADDLVRNLHVRLKVPVREWHGGTRHPAGRVLTVYSVHLADKGDADACIWLLKPGKNWPCMGVYPVQVEFIEALAVEPAVVMPLVQRLKR